MIDQYNLWVEQDTSPNLVKLLLSCVIERELFISFIDRLCILQSRWFCFCTELIIKGTCILLNSNFVL